MQMPCVYKNLSSFQFTTATSILKYTILYFLPKKNVAQAVEAKGFNPRLIVLLLVGGLLLLFIVRNYILHIYAQKTLPPMKKKLISKKKLKEERLKQGVSAPRE